MITAGLMDMERRKVTLEGSPGGTEADGHEEKGGNRRPRGWRVGGRLREKMRVVPIVKRSGLGKGRIHLGWTGGSGLRGWKRQESSW